MYVHTYDAQAHLIRLDNAHHATIARDRLPLSCLLRNPRHAYNVVGGAKLWNQGLGETSHFDLLTNGQ